MGALVAHVGQQDPQFVVTNADGNAASGINNINVALKIIHPTPDETYFQQPQGQVYEPLSEDACAGLAAAQALFGGTHPVVFLRVFCHQRPAHLADGHPGHGRTAPFYPFDYYPVYRRGVGTGAATAGPTSAPKLRTTLPA